MHNKLGQYIPTLQEPLAWAKEYLIVLHFVSGVPHLFVTLTANDNGPELKKFLNGVAPHFDLWKPQFCLCNDLEL